MAQEVFIEESLFYPLLLLIELIIILVFTIKFKIFISFIRNLVISYCIVYIVAYILAVFGIGTSDLTQFGITDFEAKYDLVDWLNNTSIYNRPIVVILFFVIIFIISYYIKDKEPNDR